MENGTYLVVPAVIFFDGKLTDFEKIFLAFLRSYEDNHKRCYASADYIAARLNKPRDLILKTRKVLAENGYLKRIQDPTTGIWYLQTSKRYTPTKLPQDVRIEGDDWEERGDETPHEQMCESKCAKSPPANNTKAKTEEEQLAESMLEEATGFKPWENDNRFILVGRRPMKEWPDIWLTSQQLVQVLHKLQESQLEPSRYRDVFDKATSRLETWKIAGKSTKAVDCFSWLTGFVFIEVLNESNSVQRLKRTLERK